jgi:nucleoside-diphosphate-sugar epimerase
VTHGLALPDAGPCGADEVFRGDARDPELMARAVHGADGVVHLAAIPSPNLAPAEEVFTVNTGATFTTLEQAARAGVRRAVIASSFSITGLPFAREPLVPAYLPVDEDLPLQVEDPYALSKLVDEAVAAMMWRRYGLSTVALRFPYLGDPAVRLPHRVAEIERDPVSGARDLWSYLDVRDAARACRHGLTAPPPGCHVVGLAAPETLSPYPTEALLDRYLPGVERRGRFPGRTVPIDLTRARTLLGFTAEHPYQLDERPLP